MSQPVSVYFTFDEFQKVNWRHLNRVLNKEVAGQHLSDQELLLLGEWHRHLKKMLQDKGQKYAILTRLLQNDIDDIEVQISNRGLAVQNRISLNDMAKDHLNKKEEENAEKESPEEEVVEEQIQDQQGGEDSPGHGSGSEEGESEGDD